MQGCVIKLVLTVRNWGVFILLEWILELSISETKDKPIYLPALVMGCPMGFLTCLNLRLPQSPSKRNKCSFFQVWLGLPTIASHGREG